MKAVKMIEFWSDIRNVENASPEDIQKDILAYLNEIQALRGIANQSKPNHTFKEMRTIANHSFTARPKRWINELCDEVERLKEVIVAIRDYAEARKEISMYLESIYDACEDALAGEEKG